MFKSTKLADFLYRVSVDNKSVFVGFAVKTEANSSSDLSVFDSVFEALDGDIDVPNDSTICLVPVDKSTEARVEITKHINIADNGTIIGFLCKSVTVLNYAIKVMEKNAPTLPI